MANARRLPLRSLRWRLAASVAAVLIVCSAITFVAVYRGTGSRLRGQIDNEMASEASELAAALRASHATSPARLRAAAQAYIRGEPVSTGSSVLFVTIPGLGTSSNDPQLFAPQPPDDGETQAEQDAENAATAGLLTGGPGFSTVTLDDVGQLRLLRERLGRITPAGQVVIGVAESLRSVSRAQAGVARAFLMAGLLSLAGALLAAFLIGTRLSNPLRRMAVVAAEVEAGDLHHRIRVGDSAATEVGVLADAFNHMLDRLADAFAVQRAFVADASHELRTPLTVIRGQLEVLAAGEPPSAAEIRRVEQLVAAEVARISRLVDDLLLLARSEQPAFLRVEPLDVEQFVTELLDGVGPLAGEREVELSLAAHGTLTADPDRLAQALRNLIANAIEHTDEHTGVIRLEVRAVAPGRLSLAVQDNGPGIAEDQRELVFERFHRTDPARARSSGGAGLGLAIVKAIVLAHEGTVRAAPSARGARIEIELPGFHPAAPAPARAGVAAGAGRTSQADVIR